MSIIRLFEPGFIGKHFFPPVETPEASLSVEQSSPSDLLSLAEAFSWCKLQELTSTPEESPDVRRRRAMVVEAGRLYGEAYKRGESYSDGPLFRKGHVLFENADMSSLVLLRAQLRTPDFLTENVLENLSAENFQDAFSLVASKRRESLKRLGAQITLPSSEGNGRFLYYWPHENLSCGAAEYSSNGFFDVDNVPPWDTWVSFDGGVLVSWVPTILIPFAQAGIDANPEACIAWAK